MSEQRKRRDRAQWKRALAGQTEPRSLVPRSNGVTLVPPIASPRLRLNNHRMHTLGCPDAITSAASQKAGIDSIASKGSCVRGSRSERSMATASDSMAELLRARWVRAVDLLWRETVRRRKALADAERLQATRRVKA